MHIPINFSTASQVLRKFANLFGDSFFNIYKT